MDLETTHSLGPGAWQQPPGNERRKRPDRTVSGVIAGQVEDIVAPVPQEQQWWRRRRRDVPERTGSVSRQHRIDHQFEVRSWKEGAMTGELRDKFRTRLSHVS